MRKLHIRSVKPGEKLARPVFTENGQVLLGAGIALSQRYIDRLISFGVETVYVEDPYTTDIMPEEPIRDETRHQAVATVYKTMTDLIDSVGVKRRIAVPDLGETYRKVFGKILEDLSTRKSVLVHLSNLHVMDGYLFHHSVNVAVLAGIMGISKGYNQKQLLELGVGALLFDIGMTTVPKELWNKKGALTPAERERIARHTVDGFQLLKQQHDISLLSAHCALQHHERYTGEGYPRQLKEKEIHEYAQIVALADVYDALVSPRSYRTGYTPGEATEFLFAAGNRFFDLDLVQLFLSHIAVYPIASTVQLNTGQIGVVARVSPLATHRPVVRILYESEGNPVSAPYEVDLQKEYNLVIVKML